MKVFNYKKCKLGRSGSKLKCWAVEEKCVTTSNGKYNGQVGEGRILQGIEERRNHLCQTWWGKKKPSLVQTLNITLMEKTDQVILEGEMKACEILKCKAAHKQGRLNNAKTNFAASSKFFGSIDWKKHFWKAKQCRSIKYSLISKMRG